MSSLSILFFQIQFEYVVNFVTAIQGDEEGLRQAGLDQMEDESMLSIPDKLSTPKAQDVKNHIFECVSEEEAKTLNEVSHSKEVRNSAANKTLVRMILQDEAHA